MTKPRQDRERGATAAVVAIFMVVMVGCAAFAVDAGTLWSDRKEVQNGADAGVMAVARLCATQGTCTTAEAKAIADKYALGNHSGDSAATVTLNLSQSRARVEVASTRQHWFAGVWGKNNSVVRAAAEAQWMSNISKAKTLPIAFGKCEWEAQVELLTGGGMDFPETEVTIKLPKKNDYVPAKCGKRPNTNDTPGGFGWLNAPTGCSVTTNVGWWVGVDPGASEPGSCGNADFEALQNRTILIPIYDDTRGTGSNGEYRIYGFAAFKITAYDFVQHDWNCYRLPGGCGTGNNQAITGFFTGMVFDPSQVVGTDPNAPDLGVDIVRMTK